VADPAPNPTLPPLSSLARGAVPRVLEGAIVPAAVFLVLLHFAGVAWAIGGGFAWSGSVVLARTIRGRPVPTLVLVGLGALAVRTALALAAHSTFVYFLQPTIGTAAVGVLFLASAFAGRPLLLRFARDFCPIPDDVMSHGPLRRFFLGSSVLWGCVQLANAAVTLWLLLSHSIGSFVVLRTGFATALTIATVGATIVWFRWTLRPAGDPVVAPAASSPSTSAPTLARLALTTPA